MLLFPLSAAHPVGISRASILRTILPNSRRVKWLSASDLIPKTKARCGKLRGEAGILMKRKIVSRSRQEFY